MQETLSEIQVREVIKPEEILDFVRFPLHLYQDSPYFVPSLIKEELEIWDPAVNTSFEYCESKQFLAYRGKEIVGRIAVIINHKEAKELGIHKVRFGWFDFIDDKSVSCALLRTAADFAKKRNIPVIEGPMGFTNLDKAGMLTFGFNRLATMIGIYNHPYYPSHLEALGFRKDKEWVEFEIMLPDQLPEKVIRFSDLTLEKYGLKVLRFKSKKEILPLIDPMFRLLDKTYKGLSTYTPITDSQIKTYEERYFKFINKDFLICIADKNDELIAFAVTMPSYSRALQKSKGKILPFGWWHFWRAGIRNDRANFYLIGIDPDYQRRGLTSIIFREIYDVFRRKGVRFLETNPELEENKHVQLLWQDYHPENHKRRRTYSILTDDFPDKM